MRYFLYARKSTDEEDRQILSIEAQLTETKEYAIKENLNIVQEFIESKTAKVPGRPIFNEMIRLLEHGKAEGIVAWHPDRLARNSMDGGKIIYLADKGIIQDLKFPTYRFDNTAQGKFMLSIAFGQSKYYVDNLAENIKRGIRQKIRNGVYSGPAPVGYLNDPKTRTIVIDKDKAPLVRKLFELYATSDYNLERLIDTITALGFATRNGKRVSLSKCQLILSNPFYYGLMRYWGETFEGRHEPIITKKLFDRVQEVVRRRGKPRKQHKHYFALRGFMHCAKCGAMITAEIQKGFHYYHCTRKIAPCRHSKHTYVREEDIAKQIRVTIQKVSLCDDWTAKILKELEKDRGEAVHPPRPQQQNLQRQLSVVDNKLNKLMDLFLDGLILKDEYKPRKEKLLAEKKDLQEILRDFAAGGDNWFERAKQFVTTLNRASYVVREGNLESQKEFLQKIGSNFILKERRLYLSPEKPFRDFIKSAPFHDWWS
jgi:site-specific DNA recombinase